MSHHKVEVGVTLLNKTVNSPESAIAFIKAENISDESEGYVV